MKERRFKIYAPLLDFLWEGDTFAFATDLEIKRIKRPPELAPMDEWLAAPEWERASNAAHWLVHEHAHGAIPHAGEIENLVLLALWLVKPTKTQIAHRFKVGLAETDGENGMSRLLDRFMWIRVPSTSSSLRWNFRLPPICMQRFRRRVRCEEE